MKWKCRYAPSLGALERTHQEVWGTEEYVPEKDLYEPVVFFGLYGLPDWYLLWRHKGKKAVLWAGSDIKHFLNGYWLDGEGNIKIDPKGLAVWLNWHCDNYVENEVEQEALRTIGIDSTIIPSYLGNIKEHPISFSPNIRPKVYVSSGINREIEYGFQIIEEIADKCDVDFYLYGGEWQSQHKNVIVRGRIPKDEMNEEIRCMQSGLRLNEFDGFSEILAKSILWGQYPISRIPYPFIDSYRNNDELIKMLNELKLHVKPNVIAREYYQKNLNNYPWNENNK